MFDFCDRTMHTLWTQDKVSAPALVQNNFSRLRRLNPDYEVIVHERDSVQQVLGDTQIVLPDDITSQALSDIFRITLLSQHGGIWTDATVFPVRRLADWLEPIVEKTDFWHFPTRTIGAVPWLRGFLLPKRTVLSSRSGIERR